MSDDAPPDQDASVSGAALPSQQPAYEVGYRKPPMHARWRKGQSGNAKGRRRGAKGFKQDVANLLKQPVGLADGRTMTTQQAALATLRAKALKGDQRALDRLVELARQQALDAAADTTPSAAPLSDKDNALIEAALQRRASAAEGECS